MLSRKYQINLKNRAARAERPITDAEIMILKYISHGLTEKMIGDAMNYSEEYIAQMIKELRYKLKAKNIAHMMRKAFEIGILT